MKLTLEQIKIKASLKKTAKFTYGLETSSYFFLEILTREEFMVK